MVDDNPEDTTPSPDSGRARRAPPTIDLEPAEVSGETRNAGEDVQPPDGTQPEPTSREPAPAISPWVIAAMSGAVAASLVICVGWMLGWPAVLPATSSAPPFNAAVIDDLAARRQHRGQDQQACSGGARSRHGQSRRRAGEIPCLVARRPFGPARAIGETGS